MSHEITHGSAPMGRDPRSFALLEIAAGLANGVHTLVPGATAAVVVEVGRDWQLLATRGPLDVSATWRASAANQVRDSDLPQQHADCLVAPFSSVGMHALLILETASPEQMPRRAYGTVQQLLDAGGILLDRALEVQQRDRAVRRVVRPCEAQRVRPLSTTDELEQLVGSLWPGATARFHTPDALDGTCWSSRRLVRVACDLGRPSVGRTPAYDGLMPRELAHLVAIPVPSHRGALLVEAPAGGEDLDTSTLATAISLTRELDAASTFAGATRLLHHA